MCIEFCISAVFSHHQVSVAGIAFLCVILVPHVCGLPVRLSVSIHVGSSTHLRPEDPSCLSQVAVDVCSICLGCVHFVLIEFQ